MKRTTFIYAIAIISLSVMITGSFAANMLSTVIHKKTDIIGTNVSNPRGDYLGRITELSYHKDTGDIIFVILSQVDFKENKVKLIPVPLDAMRFTGVKRAELNMTREKLATAPSFEEETLPDMTDREWSSNTLRFYGIRPSWE